MPSEQFIIDIKLAQTNGLSSGQEINIQIYSFDPGSPLSLPMPQIPGVPAYDSICDATQAAHTKISQLALQMANAPANQFVLDAITLYAPPNQPPYAIVQVSFPREDLSFSTRIDRADSFHPIQNGAAVSAIRAAAKKLLEAVHK
jgi:hypothetical protein